MRPSAEIRMDQGARAIGTVPNTVLLLVSITETEFPPKFATTSRVPSSDRATPCGLAPTAIVVICAPVDAFKTDTVFDE